VLEANEEKFARGMSWDERDVGLLRDSRPLPTYWSPLVFVRRAVTKGSRFKYYSAE
jgi:hypothetical protein